MNDLPFKKFQEGDSRAFEFFFKKYYDSLVGFTRQFIVDADQSKCIAQEAFVKLWLHRRKIQEPKGIQPFLYRTAKNECLNWLRHKKVEHKYSSFYLSEKERKLNIEVLKSLEFDTLTFDQLEELVEQSISALPEKCRLVFLKKRFENKRTKDIAAELGITSKAVEANMTRAIKMLKFSLSDYISLELILALSTFLLKKWWF